MVTHESVAINAESVDVYACTRRDIKIERQENTSPIRDTKEASTTVVFLGITVAGG